MSLYPKMALIDVKKPNYNNGSQKWISGYKKKTTRKTLIVVNLGAITLYHYSKEQAR